MEAKYPEITLGEPVCEKLKDIFYPDKHWSSCVYAVANKFSALKVIARKFYTGKTELEMLRELSRYTKEDIIDSMGI